MIVQAEPQQKAAPRIEKPAHARGIHEGRLRILERDKFECQYCGLDLLRDLPTFFGATVDHVWPKCRGGEKTPENLVACCLACNDLKKDFPAHTLDEARTYVTAKRTEYSSYLLRVLDFHDIEVPAKRGRSVNFHADLIHALGGFSGQVMQIVRRLADLGDSAGAIMERLQERDRVASPFDVPSEELSV